MIGKNGQSSFEVMFLATLVIIISIAIVGKYLVVGDQTLAMSVAKYSITEKLSRQPIAYTVKTLESNDCGSALHLKVTTTPTQSINGSPFNTAAFGAANTSAVQKDVATVSSFTSINLKVNEGITPCS